MWDKGTSNRFSLLSGEELTRLLRLTRLSCVGACGQGGREDEGVEPSRDPTPHSAETAGPQGWWPLWKGSNPTSGRWRTGPPSADGPVGCSVLTSWVTRWPIWMGGGVGTEELFTCHARGLVLNTWLASLRLAEEGGHLMTKLVPQRAHPRARGELFA